MAASTLQKLYFYFFHFLTLTLLVHSTSKPTLLRSDHEALLLIQKSLNSYNSLPKNPCNNSNGSILCENRISNNSKTLRITHLLFSSQHLTGKISPAIRVLSELKELSLPNNRLFDKIPTQIIQCQKLEILNLSKNRLSGKIPDGLFSLTRLRTLDLSSNNLVGNLNFLKHFPNLEKLNLADNMFEGKIPFSIRSFRNLRFINLSGNTLLDNHIPFMNHLEKSSNKNHIFPKRYVFTETNHSNSALPPSAEDPSSFPASSSHHHRRNKKKKIRGWVSGFLAGILTGTVSGLAFSLVYRMLSVLIKGRGKDGSLKIFSPMIKKPEDLAFLEKENGLASLEIIGKGGCGEVYKGVLPGINGKEIAIKKIIQPPRNADELAEDDSKLLTKKMRQIRSEIQTVGQIRHRNLLPLLAHLPRPDCHYLVYEYMKNGSLQDWLQQGRVLDWITRHKIAIGIASGLEYLHMSHTPRIIHRDLKPANILLDDEMEVRIADFGLAKAVPDAHTHVSTSNVAGTVGYIAPEYYQTFKFTDKCDIYSFGVVLGVLVIGKLPSDNFFQNTDEMSLVKWMRSVMTSEDPKRAIDPRLLGSGFEEQMLLVLKVACFCTLENPKERPNSKDARCMLSQIKH